MNEPLADHQPRRRLRIALYSHDTMGLGHTRRNLLIAQTLVNSHLDVDILLITGAHTSSQFRLPAHVDVLTLPSLHKDESGQYASKSLEITLEELLKLRRRTIRAALKAFKPHVLIVDNVPRGAGRELDRVLEKLRRKGKTRVVLGLRDVLDEPAATRAQWAKLENELAIRNYFDAVWVYGDAKVFNPALEYGFTPEVTQKVRFLGYLDARTRLENVAAEDTPEIPTGRFALCLVGGGQDGAPLAEAFSSATLPKDMSAVLVTGPHMPPEVQERLKIAAARNPKLRLLEFVNEPAHLIASADRVVSMGGYNSVIELLSFQKHALIVPRIVPRLEQLVRAERLQALGLLEVLHPDDISSAAISTWLQRDLGSTPNAFGCLDMNGLSRLPSLIEELLPENTNPLLISNPTIAEVAYAG
jgi:predicted glycosyltransferase